MLDQIVELLDVRVWVLMHAVHEIGERDAASEEIHRQLSDSGAAEEVVGGVQSAAR